ncbi:hypothetical protein [Marinobacterium sp. BA1]|uniref:hypothetical protein n=1 Tax=Marinobacterium sp. BA1 TaxID=3138931 RepID=UPI0032E70F3C
MSILSKFENSEDSYADADLAMNSSPVASVESQTAGPDTPFDTPPVPVDISGIQPQESPRGNMMQTDLLNQSVFAYERNDPLPDSYKNLTSDQAKSHWIELYNGMTGAGYSPDLMLSLYGQAESLLQANPVAAPALQSYMVANIDSLMQRYGFKGSTEEVQASSEFVQTNLESGDLGAIYNAVHTCQDFNPQTLRSALDRLENASPELSHTVDVLYQLADEKTAANANLTVETDLSEFSDHLPAARWLAASELGKENSPISVELLSCRDSVSGVPQKLKLMKIDPEKPVMIGERGGEPILAKEGFLIQENGQVRFASDEEVKRRAKEAEEDMKRNGQRPGGILSTLLNKPVTLAMEGLNATRDAIRHQINPEHLSKWRESRMLHTAEDAKTHLQSARNTLDGIMEHPDVAQLRQARDAINVRDGDLFAEYEKQKINDKIQKTINSNPELKQSFDAAMADVDLAASKHKEFLESARKHNLRPDQLLDMDKVDSKMLDDLKKKMKEIGLRNDSKSFESLEKMGEKIREVVQALVERFKNSFGMKQ